MKELRVFGVMVYLVVFMWQASPAAATSNHCALQSFQAERMCTTTYRNSFAICQSGARVRMPDGCFTIRETENILFNKCQGECNKRSEKCGLNSAVRGETCVANYGGGSGVCADGSTVTIRDYECRSEASRRQEVAKECAKRQCFN